MSSRFLLVELDGGLAESRYVGLFHAIRLHVGVHAVTDLEAISQETLDFVLLKPEPVVFEPEAERVEQLALV